MCNSLKEDGLFEKYPYEAELNRKDTPKTVNTVLTPACTNREIGVCISYGDELKDLMKKSKTVLFEDST
jgi:hypothetical protein